MAEGVTLDDVLSLGIEDMLSRRLQTIVYKRGSAVSPLQARQLIVHRHVKIGERIVSVPGYQVTSEEEKHIQLTGGIGTPKTPEPKEQQAAPAGPAQQPTQQASPAPTEGSQSK